MVGSLKMKVSVKRDGASRYVLSAGCPRNRKEAAAAPPPIYDDSHHERGDEHDRELLLYRRSNLAVLDFRLESYTLNFVPTG